MEAVLAAMNVRNVRFESRSGIPRFPPRPLRRVTAGGVELGVLGQLHPPHRPELQHGLRRVRRPAGLPGLLEQRAGEARYEPSPASPSVTRDIAVVCGDDVTVAAPVDCIGRGARGLLKEVELFDIYTGAPIPAGRKSVAFNLTLRAEDRSLTAAEADEDVKSVLALLESELGALCCDRLHPAPEESAGRQTPPRYKK